MFQAILDLENLLTNRCKFIRLFIGLFLLSNEPFNNKKIKRKKAKQYS